MHRDSRLVFVCLLALLPITLFAQGTTGTLVGTVTSDGAAFPGVLVTISSPSLQGTRTAVTGEGGGYHFQSLPPGTYTVRFELEGMQPVVKTVTVGLAQNSRSDADLRMAAASESLTVTAAAPAVIETTQVTANFTANQINELPTGREIRDIVLLAPGVSEGAVNDQIVISGAMSFDNLFLVNGVVVNENLRGQPQELFIEDAIQETTILSGGVSAEFGRFTGGVVSTLTKSGGNEFSGSFRDSIANPNWSSKTAYENQVDNIDELNETYEATFGGRLIQDRLWFFTAGRHEDRETGMQLRLTNIPYVETRQNRRWEAKLTGQITPKHNVVGSFMKNEHDHENIITFGPVVDLRSLATRTNDETLLGLNYNGVLTTSLLLEAQFSRMDDDLVRGSNTRDLIEGTLLRDSASGNRMWSPSGCGAPCGTKQHDNSSWLIKPSYFLSTRSLGNHSMVAGIEEFHQYRSDNNFQSGSDFWIHGRIIQNPNNPAELGFGIDPSSGGIEWDPVPALSSTSDFAVRSVFFNDKWELNSRWNFNVGARFDETFGKNQAGVKTVDDSAFSPRLGATFDPSGNGKHRFGATYGRYVAKVEQGPADLTAPAGRYSYYFFDYAGPTINPPGTPFNELVPIPEVIRRIFEWFNSPEVGGTSNTELLSDISIPGYTTRFEKSLTSPWMDEFTLGYSLAINNRSFIRADYINRSWGDFYALRRTLETGKATDPTGLVVDQGVIENSESGLERKYRAVQFQGSYRPFERFTIGGNYTWSELEGNIDGETSGGATTLTSNPDRPEYTGFERNNPVGILAPDMTHRMNLWLRYDLATPVGSFNFSLLERYRSGLSYSAVGTIDVRRSSILPNGVVNPGYASVPSNVSYYFSDRGEFRLDDITSTDLGVNWGLPLGPTRLFVEVDLLNIFNEQGLEDPDFINRTVLTRRQSSCLQSGTTDRCLAFNPLAGEAPVEGVHWQKSSSFGNPTGPDAYQLPRTYRFSVGLRF